jgi:cell division protein FtsB
MAIAADTLWGPSGWPRHRALATEVAAITQENAELTAQLALLHREIAAQAERPEVQEALVRDLLGYVRAHDVVVRLADAQAPSP